MPILVQKYGGTSVGSPERIRAVADRIIASKKKGNQMVVVVSAMGHTTDQLIDLMHNITDRPDPREYDMLLSTGEQVSAALVAMAIQKKGHAAVSLTGGQAGIETEDIYSKARIKGIKLDRIKRELAAGKIVIITGFQGIDSKGDIITIGRGGSDTSAVVVAAALKAKSCEIYTDVDGVYTADPRVVKDAKRLSETSYEEMLELASVGSQVLHPRSVECAKIYGIPLHVRSSWVSREGTIVREVTRAMEKRGVISGVAADTNVVKVGLLKIPDRPGIASKLFGALARANVSVDMIIQSVHEESENADIAFTVSKSDQRQALVVANKVAKELKAKGVVADDSLAKVSIVGVGMIGTPGVAARMFEILAKEKVNLEMISTSEIRISCIVASKDAQKAVKALHKAFGLG